MKSRFVVVSLGSLTFAAMIAGCSSAPQEGAASSSDALDVPTCAPLERAVPEYEFVPPSGSGGSGSTGGSGGTPKPMSAGLHLDGRVLVGYDCSERLDNDATCPATTGLHDTCTPPKGPVKIPDPPSPQCTAPVYEGLLGAAVWIFACPTGTPAPPDWSVAQSSQTDCGTCYGPLLQGWSYYSVGAVPPGCQWVDGPGALGWHWDCPLPGGGCSGNCKMQFPPS